MAKRGGLRPHIPNLGAVSSNLAGDIPCRKQTTIGAVRRAVAPFSLWQAIRVINYVAWAIPKA